jgi:hypothetical protein
VDARDFLVVAWAMGLFGAHRQGNPAAIRRNLRAEARSGAAGAAKNLFA